jgi:hypothetical protein
VNGGVIKRQNRRNFLKPGAVATAGTGVAKAQTGPTKKVHSKGRLFSGAVYGNLLFIAGKGET